MVTRRKLWVSVSLRVIIRKANIFSSRDSPTRFSTSGFFHHSNQSGPLTNRLKYFRLLLRIGWVIQILSSKIWLPGVWYPGESVSPGYDTPASQSPRPKKNLWLWKGSIGSFYLIIVRFLTSPVSLPSSLLFWPLKRSWFHSSFISFNNYFLCFHHFWDFFNIKAFLLCRKPVASDSPGIF